MQKVYEIISHAWIDSIKETYYSGLFAFHTFYNLKNISEKQCALISPNLTSTFISILSGIYIDSTVVNYLNTLHTWHIIHRVQHG